MLELVEQHSRPVISPDHPDVRGNKFGCEGGRVVRLGEVFHLLTSEPIADPWAVKMRLAHWISEDKLHWRRISTLYESSGTYNGMDDRAALWSPIPIYDENAKRWNLFYVAYRSLPSTRGMWLQNFEGKIWRAVSQRSGSEGIGGPYEDVGIVMRPTPTQDEWEGLQGTASFFPYQIGDRWYALYGSAQSQFDPIHFWGVGLANAPALDGPWTRCSEHNPVLLHETFTENPIVTRFKDGTFGCVADSGHYGRGFAYAQSSDGVHWGKSSLVALREDDWLRKSRTPLGLVPREDGLFDLFFTGFMTGTERFGAMGWVVLRR